MSKRNDTKPAARHARGVFERPKGSGVWWVRFHDEHGREHREKVGPKGLALDVYRKRKTEIAERRFFPERIRRRDILLTEVIDDVERLLEENFRSEIFVSPQAIERETESRLRAILRPPIEVRAPSSAAIEGPSEPDPFT